MTQKEFQDIHELSDDDIERIRLVCIIFKGKITSIK